MLFGWFPWFFNVVSWCFMVFCLFLWFKVGIMVFHGFWLVSMGFQCGFMVFMVFGWFPWVFRVVSWFFMVFAWFPWFFKVVSWFLVGFHGFSDWFHGFSRFR